MRAQRTVLESGNLVRLGLALLVLFSHCWPLTGRGEDPLSSWLSISGGELAVDGFFGLSGFLLYSSAINYDVRGFMVRRLKRLLPGLIAVLVLGAAIASIVALSASGSVSECGKDSVKYIGRNLFIIDPLGLRYGICNAFHGNAGGAAVNGSLWTIPYEFLCYCGLAVLAFLPRLIKNRKQANTASVAVFFGIWLVGHLLSGRYRGHFVHGITTEQTRAPRLAACFFLGSLVATIVGMLRESDSATSQRIRSTFTTLRPYLAAGLIGLVIVLSLGPGYRETARPFWVLATLTLCTFSMPSALEWFKHNDISYGVYLWAFPVQQTVAYTMGEHGPWPLLLVATPITVLVSYGSWKLIESPWLHQSFAAKADLTAAA